MHIVLERNSIDNPLTFNIDLLQLIFILMCSHNTYACKGVFNPNIPIFLTKSAEGLHFSAFHCLMLLVWLHFQAPPALSI